MHMEFAELQKFGPKYVPNKLFLDEQGVGPAAKDHVPNR